MHFTVPISQRLNKLVRSLHQKKYRDQNGLFIAEGEKICTDLLNSDYEVELVVIKDYPDEESLSIAEKFADSGVAVYSASKTQFDQLCTTKAPQGIIAVVYSQNDDLIPDKPFIALDAVSDPGNVGTIIRTAEWFGIEQVVLGRDCADKYNPKTVRSTMGALFNINVIYYPQLKECIDENFPKHQIFAASLESDTKIEDTKHKDKFGIIFGSEAHGVSKELLELTDIQYKIPGSGKSDSLNVAISAGISLYHFFNNK